MAQNISAELTIKPFISFLKENFQGDKVLIVDSDIVVFPKQISWRLEQVPNDASLDTGDEFNDMIVIGKYICNKFEP